MYDGPSSGGIATHDLTSLDDIILRVVMVPLREMYRNLTLEQIAHKNTLKLFQAFLDEELPAGKLIVNPDGWQIEAEKPIEEPDVKVDRSDLLAYLCVECVQPIPAGEEIVLSPGDYFHERCAHMERINDNGTAGALEGLEPARWGQTTTPFAAS